MQSINLLEKLIINEHLFNNEVRPFNFQLIDKANTLVIEYWKIQKELKRGKKLYIDKYGKVFTENKFFVAKCPIKEW